MRIGVRGSWPTPAATGRRFVFGSAWVGALHDALDAGSHLQITIREFDVVNSKSKQEFNPESATSYLLRSRGGRHLNSFSSPRR